jgi:hypothetical protein
LPEQQESSCFACEVCGGECPQKGEVMSITERPEAEKALRTEKSEKGAAEKMLADAGIWFDPTGQSPDKTVGGPAKLNKGIWFDPTGQSPDTTVGGPADRLPRKR